MLAHRHERRDEMLGAAWHLALAALYVGCVAFHLVSAWAHYRDSRA